MLDKLYLEDPELVEKFIFLPNIQKSSNARGRIPVGLKLKIRRSRADYHRPKIGLNSMAFRRGM